jgi:lysophospholipase L1-like esterase
MPQPVDYFAVPKYPEPGMALPVMGKTVTLNSYGSRDIDYSREKKAGVIRIAVIGDSITFGFGVDLKDTYHKRLEEKLNQGTAGTVYEVPSFNMGAADTEWAIKKYVTLVRTFHPDIVILGFCLNDILDYTELERTNEANHRAVSLKRKIISTFLGYHYLLRRYSHLYFFCLERTKPLLYRTLLDIRTKNPEYWVPIETDTPEYKVRFAATVKKLVELKNLVTKDGPRFIVVIFPYEIQLSDDHVAIYKKAYRLEGYKDAPKAEVQKQLTEALATKGIESLDLLGAYRAYLIEHPHNDLFFRSIVGIIDWMHPNEAGHEVAADAIAKYLGR